MKLSALMQSLILTSIALLPAYALGDDQGSKLINQSGQNGSAQFYLVQDKIIGENECVKVEGNKKLNPNESAQLKIKPGCKWGVVEYKVFSVKDNKEVGALKHSYHDGDYSIDITGVCKGNECSFYGIDVNQNKPK